MSPLAGPTWLGKAQTHLVVSCLHMALDHCPWVLIVLRLDRTSLGAMLFEIYEVAIGWPLVGRCAHMRCLGRWARMSYVCVCCHMLSRLYCPGRCAQMRIPAYTTGVARTAARVLGRCTRHRW